MKLRGFFIIFFLSFGVFAQEKSKLQGKGEAYLSKDQYEEMIEYIESQGDKVFDDPFYNYYLGMSFFHTPDRKGESTQYLERYLESKDSSEIAYFGHQHIYRMLGKMYHLTYKFDKAQAMYLKFINATEAIEEIPQKAKEEIISDAERQIATCEFGRIQVKNPRNVLIESLGDSINSRYAEYASVVSQDETTLIFTSRRPDTRGGKRAKEDNIWYEDIYTANLVKGSLSESENLLADTTRGQYFHLATDFEYMDFSRMTDEINSKGHDGSIQLDTEDKILYFYRDGNIWWVDVTEDPITEAKELGVHVNSNHYEPSIFFSYDGKKLFIVSDRPGGYGGLDIYVSELEGEEWSEPVNMGPNINTEYDEDAPYLDPNETTFYFSSKGHSSMGDYDIFRSTLEDTSWTVPVNLGFPINTPAEDIYFTMTKRYNRGYYSSGDLSGSGDMDLYRITFTDERDPVAELFGYVKDERGDPLEAVITLTSADETITQPTNGRDGGYFLLLGHGKSYTITIEAEGFQPYSLEFDVPELKEYLQFYQEVHMRHIKDKNGVLVGQEITLYNAFGEYHEKKYGDSDEAQIARIEDNRTIKGNIKVLKQIQFYFDRPPLERLVEEELIFDLSIEDNILVLKEPGLDPSNPDNYEVYDGPRNKAEWDKKYGEDPIVENDPNTPEGTIDGSKIEGLYFTVQIGVYSRDVPHSVMFDLKPIVTLKVDNIYYRYSTGTFKDVESALKRKNQIVNIGVNDAFVTAYYDGKRITIAKAHEILGIKYPGAE